MGKMECPKGRTGGDGGTRDGVGTEIYNRVQKLFVHTASVQCGSAVSLNWNVYIVSQFRKACLISSLSCFDIVSCVRCLLCIVYGLLRRRLCFVHQSRLGVEKSPFPGQRWGEEVR